MGYDLTRFIGEIDDEFQCMICTLVLENPIQTPCEHSFCSDCISDWLSVDQVCPVDRMPLTTATLRPPSRLLRNLLGKLDIQCDFYEHGCGDIVRLDNLQNHRDMCVFHPDSEIICDRGCSLKITRREYKDKDCIGHFENRVCCQQVEISQLKEENTKWSSHTTTGAD